MIDNFDSFTYNLYDYLYRVGVTCTVKRNNEISVESIEAMEPSAIIISPGPGHPPEIIRQVIEHFYQRIPILGICLGYQAIGEVFGLPLAEAEPWHGKTSMVKHNGDAVFKDIPNPFEAMRYHSLILTDLQGTPLQPLAYTEKGNILMALKHETACLYGFQFHPESVLTGFGLPLLRNWCQLAGLLQDEYQPVAEK